MLRYCALIALFVGMAPINAHAIVCDETGNCDHDTVAAPVDVRVITVPAIEVTKCDPPLTLYGLLDKHLDKAWSYVDQSFTLVKDNVGLAKAIWSQARHRNLMHAINLFIFALSVSALGLLSYKASNNMKIQSGDSWEFFHWIAPGIAVVATVVLLMLSGWSLAEYLVTPDLGAFNWVRNNVFNLKPR